MFRTGYITSFRGDFVWFLGLPFFALAVALASQQWLSAVALASFTLWFNTPHVFSTLIRAYGLKEDRHRFADRLIIGFVFVCMFIYLGMKWFPLTLVLVSTIWNHQHFMMQLHGFTRIYDFKAHTGGSSTGQFDWVLNMVLYGNMFITAPLFTKFWVRELYHFGMPIGAGGVDTIHIVSWIATAVFGVLYIAHVAGCLRRGHPLNPIKYLFLASNYLVLYYVSYHTASLLLHGIANVIMHSVQYFVIIYLYTRRKADQVEGSPGFVAKLFRPGVPGVLAFVGICVIYSMLLQYLLGRPLDEFGFGVVSFMNQYGEVPVAGLGALSDKTGLELYLLIILGAPGLLHLYYDSFIWKVREEKSQAGF